MQQKIALSIHRTASVVSLLGEARAMGFDLRVLGQSNAAIVPQQVGPWWMEPYRLESDLPARAQLRLQRLLEAGLQPKAVVLFHEIPTANRQQRSKVGRLMRRVVSSGVLWAQQELPVRADRAAQHLASGATQAAAIVRRYMPIAGRFLVRATIVIAPILGAIAVGILLTSARVLAAAFSEAILSDPCLVVVTKDGYWIEVDRWDE